jgi:hypothetical protein
MLGYEVDCARYADELPHAGIKATQQKEKKKNSMKYMKSPDTRDRRDGFVASQLFILYPRPLELRGGQKRSLARPKPEPPRGNGATGLPKSALAARHGLEDRQNLKRWRGPVCKWRVIMHPRGIHHVVDPRGNVGIRHLQQTKHPELSKIFVGG